VRVGDVDDVVVFCDFRYEGAAVQVVGDGHADAEDKASRVLYEDVFDADFGVGVEAAAEVGWVLLCEGRAG
jgi:hypothetical protein